MHPIVPHTSTWHSSIMNEFAGTSISASTSVIYSPVAPGHLMVTYSFPDSVGESTVSSMMPQSTPLDV